MRRSIAIGFALALATSSAPVHAASEAANEIVDRTITETCGGKGEIDPKGLVERDLTGDGEADLLIDYGFISCHEGMNGFCGSGGCSVSIHVFENGRLTLKEELFGVETQVLNGKPPRIRVKSRDGGSQTIRWKGGRFR
jgi:hypothetical protein